MSLEENNGCGVCQGGDYALYRCQKCEIAHQEWIIKLKKEYGLIPKFSIIKNEEDLDSIPKPGQNTLPISP